MGPAAPSRVDWSGRGAIGQYGPVMSRWSKLSIGGLAMGMAAAAAGTGAAVGAPAGGGAGIPALRIDGRGWGHGVGLAQDGELYMGQRGDSFETILGQFYPGTYLAHAGGTVRVEVLTAFPGADGTAGTTLVFPAGGEILDAASGPQSPGFPLRVPPGQPVTVSVRGGVYRTSVPAQVSAQSVSPPVTVLPPPSSSTTSTTSGSSGGGSGSGSRSGPGGGLLNPLPASPTTTQPDGSAGGAGSGGTGSGGAGSGGGGGSEPPSGSGSGAHSSPGRAPATETAASSSRPLWAVPADSSETTVLATGRRYRGVVEALAASGGGNSPLDLVNQLDVESYLRGMGEVQDPAWPLASLEAQAIIERTYALRAMQAAGEICDDTRCQVYLGAQAEYPAQDQAVADTAGLVLGYGGQLADTVFSANAGGFSASPEEGFGSSGAGYPYLRAAPYPTDNPDPWSLTVALSAVAARLGYPGDLTSAAVSSVGPSGRALVVTLEGSAGVHQVSGLDFESAMGLRSNLVQLHDTTSDTPPPPPPPPRPPQQALPSDAGALHAAMASPAPVAGAGAHDPLTASARRVSPGAAAARAVALALLVLVGAAAYRRIGGLIP